MKERMERRWGQLTAQEVQQIADHTPYEQYSKSGFSDGEYMPEFSERLAGKELKIHFDNETEFFLAIEAGNHIRWQYQNGEIHEERAQIAEAPGEPELFFLQYYCRKSVPPTCHTFVIDFKTGLVTFCNAHLGVPASAREVGREFLFGIMEGYEDTGKRHKFTDELVGTAIYWTYKEEPTVKIKHIYTAPKYYTYQMSPEDDKCWVASNPADYVKINDHMYIFAFIEERQNGAQGFFLINLQTLHDVGAFFSINALGIECAMVGAKGELTEPYAWDWCEAKSGH